MNISVKAVISTLLNEGREIPYICVIAHSLYRNFYIKSREELKEVYDYIGATWHEEFDYYKIGSLKHVDLNYETIIYDLNNGIDKPRYTQLIDKDFFRYLLDNAHRNINSTNRLIDYVNHLDISFFPLKFFILDEIKIRRLCAEEKEIFTFDKKFPSDPKRDSLHSVRDVWAYLTEKRESNVPEYHDKYNEVRDWIIDTFHLDQCKGYLFAFLVEEFLSLFTKSEANTIKARYYIYPNDFLFGMNYVGGEDMHMSHTTLKAIETKLKSIKLYKTSTELCNLYEEYKDEIHKNCCNQYIELFREFMYGWDGEK